MSKTADDWYEKGYEDGSADADTHIKSLLIRIAVLESAIKPFADAADDLEDDHIGGNIWESPAALDITAGDLRNCQRLLDSSRAARAALEKK